MTSATWFLSPHFPKFEFLLPFLVVKICVAIRVAFRQNASVSKDLKHFGRTFLRYRSHILTVSVAHSYGIGRTFLRYRGVRLLSFPQAIEECSRELRGV